MPGILSLHRIALAGTQFGPLNYSPADVQRFISTWQFPITTLPFLSFPFSCYTSHPLHHTTQSNTPSSKRRRHLRPQTNLHMHHPPHLGQSLGDQSPSRHHSPERQKVQRQSRCRDMGLARGLRD